MKNYSKQLQFFVTLCFLAITLSNCSSDADVEREEIEQVPPAEIVSFLNVSDFDLPSQDENGFTILTTQPDSRIIYVDSNIGNDSTAEVYEVGAADIGADPFTPNNTIKPFKTIAAAQDNMRRNQPDVLLLAAGGIWEESLPVTNGRSSSERSIYASYGQGNRPELRAGRGIDAFQVNNIIIAGIRFWSHTRDDQGPYFDSNFSRGGNGFGFIVNDDEEDIVANVLIEDCVFRSYRGNVLTGVATSGQNPIDKFVLRRSIISGSYTIVGHSQGLFYDGSGETDGTAVLLEENIFDHNGWRVQQIGSGNDPEDGQATFFNHNTYFGHGKGILFYGNVFMRGSSIGNKWTAQNGEGSARNIAMIDNLYVDGEIGIDIGGNAPGPLRFKNIVISDNVLLNIGKSKPTNRTLSNGMKARDWDGGEIKNNLILHQEDETITNLYGIYLEAESQMRNVNINGNIVYGLTGASNSRLELLRISDLNAENLNITDNYFHSLGNSSIVTYDGGDGFNFSNNFYKSENEDGNWFRSNNTSLDMDEWLTSFENDAKSFEVADEWPDPSRDIESYSAMLGIGGSTEAFIEALHNQSKSNWNPNLTAPYINRWIREGFGK